MATLLGAILIYAAVFFADYMFYVKQPNTYQYVSRQTLGLFLSGIGVLVALFWPLFKPYAINWPVELMFIGMIFVVLTLFTKHLEKQGERIYHTTSRSERALSPLYIQVKGAEIIFQQLTYLIIAVAVVNMIGFGTLAFILFVQILIVMHTPVILSFNREVAYKLSFGLAVIAAPMLYSFIEIGYFFPAVYLHGALFVFYWAAFAKFDNNPPNPGITPGIGG